MKKILLIFCAGIATVFSSCVNDTDPVGSAQGLQLRQDSSVVPTATLDEANANNDFIKLKWDAANNGVPSESRYVVLISDRNADPNFANPVEFSGAGTENTKRESLIKIGEMNTLLNRLPSFNCGQMQIDIRVKSTLGVNPSNAIVQYSNPITISVTGYSKNPLVMAFVKEGADPSVSSKVVSSSYTNATDYEGFMYLEAGNYKFYQPDPCGSYATPTIFGVSGGNSGTLVSGGSSSYNVPSAGHYFVKVDVTGGTYTITPFNNTTASNVLGIFGNATKTIAFQNTTPMAYDLATKKWKVTISLIDGKKFSFKTGNTSPVAAVLTGTGSAAFNVNNSVSVSTAAIDNSGTIKAPGAYVNDNTKTKYDIYLDLNTPRQYSYTIEVNPN